MQLLGAESDGVLFGAELAGPDYSYPGCYAIDVERLERHFVGEIAIALRVGNGKGRSRWLAFDVDGRAEARVPLICGQLRQLGYGDATLVTGGSAPGRAKVILFFAREQQGSALRGLAADVLRAARSESQWGIQAPRSGEVAVKPTRGDGGKVRIGGRNVWRNGSVEPLCNAWFEPCDFADVAPSTKQLRPVRTLGDLKASPPQVWVERDKTEGITWAGGTRRMNAYLNRLAAETIRTEGMREAGEAEFRKRLEAIAAVSPELNRPSPTTKRRKHPLAWDFHAGSAWRHQCALRVQLDTSYLAPRRYEVSTSHTVLELVALFETIVSGRGLWEHGGTFEVSSREIGAALGISHEAGRLRALRAEQLGLVVRLDPGTEGLGRKKTGKPGGGAKALYALVPAGETPQSVRARLDDHHTVRARRAFVAIELERRASLRAKRLSEKIVTFPASRPRLDTDDRPLPTARPTALPEPFDLLAYACRKLGPPRSPPPAPLPPRLFASDSQPSLQISPCR